MAWSQTESDIYRQLAVVAVPARTEQLAALLVLIPYGKDESFHVVELASGEGRLSYAVLSAFPNATVLALDGEESMRQETAQRLSLFGNRAQVGAFDMVETDWYSYLDSADVVVSSLCIHHLTGEEKQTLFYAVGTRVKGAFLIADLVLPARAEVNNLFAATWDRAARVQSLAKTGTSDLFEKFVTERWNYYRHPDPFDKPSGLFDQLLWLKAAGFETVDCFWLRAGHAIYGGYQGGGQGERLSFESAYRIADSALNDLVVRL